MSAWQHFALPVIAEILFFSLAIYCVYRAQKNRIYSSFWQYLIFRVAIALIALVEVSLGFAHIISFSHAYSLYFFTYWPSYVVEAILVLRVLHEMFRHAMRSVPGMQKMGRPIFFWAVAVSVVLACASGVSSIGTGTGFLLGAAQILARSQSVMSLCLLAFLAFASRTLGVSFGSRIFGVTFGLGLMATGNLVSSAIFLHIHSLASSANIAVEVVYLASISLWCVYFVRPEPARRMVAVPISSPLVRWNEIAQALGNPAGQVALSYPPSFMTDVHHLVDNVMGAAGWPREAASSSPPGPIAS
ncbi:MAG: hypothetical protein ABI164_11600 [Acidobacteriaceae bacterium]